MDILPSPSPSKSSQILHESPIFKQATTETPIINQSTVSLSPSHPSPSHPSSTPNKYLIEAIREHFLSLSYDTIRENRRSSTSSSIPLYFSSNSKPIQLFPTYKSLHFLSSFFSSFKTCFFSILKTVQRLFQFILSFFTILLQMNPLLDTSLCIINENDPKLNAFQYFLSQLPLFHELKEEEMFQLIQLVEYRTYPSNIKLETKYYDDKTLIQYKEKEDIKHGLYIILSGECIQTTYRYEKEICYITKEEILPYQYMFGSSKYNIDHHSSEKDQHSGQEKQENEENGQHSDKIKQEFHESDDINQEFHQNEHHSDLTKQDFLINENDENESKNRLEIDLKDDIQSNTSINSLTKDEKEALDIILTKKSLKKRIKERHYNEKITIHTNNEMVEILWINPTVLGMLNLQKRMKYEFCLILHNAHHQMKENEKILKEQMDIIYNLIQAGIEVTMIANTRNTMNYTVLLLNIPLELLLRENEYKKMERMVEYHSMEDSSPFGKNERQTSMTPADRIAAFASILTRSTTDKPRGAGIQGIENNQNQIIKDIFPLHDPSVCDFMVSSLFKKSIFSSLYHLFLIRIKDYFGLRIAFHLAFVRLYNAKLLFPMIVGVLLWSFIRWFDYNIYMIFLGIYGLLMVFSWAPTFMKHWKRYQNALLVEWNLLQAREIDYPNPEFNNYVVETINITNTNVELAALLDEQKSSKVEGDTPIIDTSTADYVNLKVYNPRKRWPKFVSFFFFVLICIILLFIFISIYVQWYIIAIMTPMCINPRCPQYLDNNLCTLHCESLKAQNETVYRFLQKVNSCDTYCDLATFDRAYYHCNAPLGCFNTERGLLGSSRWFYIFVQGVVLGVTLDIFFLAAFELIASTFNRWENYPTIREAESRYIVKIFLFNWVGYFFWFFLLAFLYVPYGEQVQSWIRLGIDQNPVLTLNGQWRYSRYWVPGLLAMDSAFLTPLVVTQALNLVINTFVPYLLRQALLRARDSYYVGYSNLSAGASRITRAALERRQALNDFALSKLGHNRNHITENYLPDFKDDESYATDGEPEIDAMKVSTNSSQTTVGGDNRPSIVRDESERRIDCRRPSRTNSSRSATDSGCPMIAFELVMENMNDEQLREIAQKLTANPPIKEKYLEAVLNEYVGLGFSEGQNPISENFSNENFDIFQRASYNWYLKLNRYIKRRLQNNDHLKEEKEKNTTVSTRIKRESSTGMIDQSIEIPFTFIKSWRCRGYLYTADKLVEESSMPVYSNFNDTLRLAIQFSYVVMFSIIWPFCALCAYLNNYAAVRFDVIKMCIDYKRPVPCRTIGIGVWLGAFMFEILVAATVVPGLFVHVTGELDAFKSSCTVSQYVYGPDLSCYTSQQRLTAYCILQNIGIAICFLVYLKQNDISSETAIRIQEQGRKFQSTIRKSIRTIGSPILVQSKSNPHEWYEGIVVWVRNGRLRVKFISKVCNPFLTSEEDEIWIDENCKYVLKSPSMIRIYTSPMNVLFSLSPGRWIEGTIQHLHSLDHFHHPLQFQPNELHLQIIRARNLKPYKESLQHFIDPYCKIVHVATGFEYKTSIKRHTHNPLWNEIIIFPVLDIFSSIKIILMNHTKGFALSDEYIGEVTIDLHQFCNGLGKTEWYPIQTKSCFRRYGEYIFNTTSENMIKVRSGTMRRSKICSSPLHRRSHSSLRYRKGTLQHQFELYGQRQHLLHQPAIELYIQWADSRCPTSMEIEFKDMNNGFYHKTVSRDVCNRKLSFGIHPNEIQHGRIYNIDTF